MQKIKSLSVIGYRTYTVGEEYNGMKLGYISNNSIEYPESIDFMYAGFSTAGACIFTAENAPTCVEYEDA